MARRKYYGGRNNPAIVTRKSAIINAPRQPYPTKLDPDTGEFSLAQIAYSKDLSVCYDLVRIAAHVMKNPKIRLKAGGEADGITRAMTDGTIVYLPKNHPQRRIVTKHEISHIYFKSNIPLRLLFVQDLLRKIEVEAKKSFDEATRTKLIEDLCFVVNIFDDLRVNSLWGLLYPGDGMDMEEWYQDDVAPRMMAKALEVYPDGNIDDLFKYMILLSLGQPAKSTRWEEFEADIKWAAGQVHYKTFNAALILVRDLLLKIARKVMADEEPPPSVSLLNPTERPETDPELQEAQLATGGGTISSDPEIESVVKERSPEPKKEEEAKELVSTLTQMANAGGPAVPDFIDDNAGFDFKDGVGVGTRDPRTLQMDMEDLDVLVEQDLEAVLQDLEQNAVEEVQEIQAALAEHRHDRGVSRYQEGDFLRNRINAKVVIHKVDRASVAPYALDNRDLQTSRKWRRFFERVLGTLSFRTEDSGDEFVPELYIQQKLSGEELSCFRVETLGHGFRVSMLIDMSGSMVNIFPEVERLARVLQLSLNFPMVNLRTWGFNSREAGRVDMYDFPKGAQGLRSQNTRTEGVTPLSHAIQVAGRELSRSQDEKHLFVLSDGFPVYSLAGSRYHISTKTLMNWTKETVQELKSQQIRVHCFMIGNHVPDAKDMTRMFGVGNWKAIRPHEVFNDSFTFIREKFLHYIQTR